MGHDLEGVFPFGAASVRCEPRRVSDAMAFVLGVYPSALHVQWTHPEARVAALAVAPEPWPFWPGDDQEDRVHAWQAEVGWQEEWGTARPVGRLNGSSGQAAAERVLKPLGVNFDGVWTTDALPFFHVHRGAETQGDAMSTRYDPFAAKRNLPRHRLPTRPPVDHLVRRALQQEGPRLQDDLRESNAPLLITLGNEALAVATALLGADLPSKLSPDDSYGTRLPARLGSAELDVLPLVHPGQRSAEWVQAHDRWIELQGRGPLPSGMLPARTTSPSSSR
jgi:hypothetical protein